MFKFLFPQESNWERGRENGSFPVAEVLKPLGFKKFCGYKILFASCRGDYLGNCDIIKTSARAMF